MKKLNLSKEEQSVIDNTAHDISKCFINSLIHSDDPFEGFYDDPCHKRAFQILENHGISGIEEQIDYLTDIAVDKYLK